MSIINYNGESKVIKRICELLDTMTGISFVVVQTLPTVDIQTNVIYLVPKQSAEVDNIYDEYINTDGTSQGWELIGTTEIDLSNYVQFSDLSTVATSGDYDDLIDKPTIPTVNDGTLTIQLNGENQQTFTANSSSDKTANIKAVDWVSNGKLGAKNLNSYPYYETSHTDSDVVWTDNGDGTVTANGQAGSTANSNFVCHSRATQYSNPLILPNGTYILSGCPSGGATTSYYCGIGVTKNGAWYSLGIDTGNGVTFTVDGDDNFNDKAYVQIACSIFRGYNAQNIKFYPMIRLATDSDSTWQPYSMTNIELTDNKASKEEAQKVKQTNVTNNAVYRFLLSKSATNNEEIDGVNKTYSLRINPSNGNLYLDRTHTSKSVQEEVIAVGNATPDGTEGANSGIVRLFGKGAYYVQFRDLYGYITGNRNYLLRDATGMLGLYNDVTDFAVKANLNVLDNLVYPTYYHSMGSSGSISYSTNWETGEYTVKGSHTSNVALQIKRYSQGFYLPAGKYKLSGCPSGGSSSKYSLRAYSSTESGQTTGIGSDYGSGLEFTLTEKTLMQIVFYVNANQSVDFTFRPKLEKLSDWVDLGNTSLGTITVDDVYSEYRAEVTLDCSYGGTTYTRNFMYNFLSDSLSSTAKSFIQTAPCQTQQIGGVVYMHCSTSAKKENNQVTIASGGTWTGGLGGTASPLFTLPTIQLYAKV